MNKMINNDMSVGEVEIHLQAENGNRNFVKDYYKTLTRTGINVRELNLLRNQFGQPIENPILQDAYNFFRGSRCVYAFVTMLWIKDIIKVYDNDLYMYDEEFNYWQIQHSTSENFISRIKDLLEKIYEIEFKYLEMIGISINSKIRTVIKDIKIDRRFKIDDLTFRNLVYQSSDWINFKNCSYNIETGDVIKDKEKRKDLFFNTYINANYIEEKIELYDEEIDYFTGYYLTSLNSNPMKLFQLGQHLIYSICTKNVYRKAKQVLFIIGGHDVGKSCLIDLFSVYLPQELVSHISPTKFSSDGAKAKLLSVKLNATHEIPANRTLPIADFNKTVWINSDEVMINNKIYSGNYMQLHQVYAANNFFKTKNEYNPKDYFPKINLLIVDGSPDKKIIEMSELIMQERDYIISFFLNFRSERYFEGRSLYEELKHNNFQFIEDEDAIDYKSDLEAEYQEEILTQTQKKERKTDYGILDYGLTKFIEEKVVFTEISDAQRNKPVYRFIINFNEITKKNKRVLLEDLYKAYANYCHSKNIEYFSDKSLLKKRLDSYWKDFLIIESKLKSKNKVIDYEKIYKEMIENQTHIVVYKKFQDFNTREIGMGYMGIQLLND